MAPRPEGISGGNANEIPNPKVTNSDRKSSDVEEEEVVRDEIFAWFDTPFGLPGQHYINRIWLTSAHVFGLYWCYLTFGGYASWNTLPWELLYVCIGELGITVGCHRYWAHKTFKANMPLQILLMIMQTFASQYPIHKWCLDHRIHHKYTDTNSDPHNSKRGLLFSHIGWLYLPKHPDLKKKLKTFAMPDLDNDPVVRFQSKYYSVMMLILHTALPVAFFMYFLELSLFWAVCANFRRYLISLHATFCVNSIAHKFGDKPFDKAITAVESPFVSFIAVGEGWHNYHHTFPWDYKAAEFGWKINLSTMLIDFFAAIGWAWDLKTVSQKMLKERLNRTGDGSHADSKAVEDDNRNGIDFHARTDVVTEMVKCMEYPLWGWDDEGMSDDFRSITTILYSDKTI